MLAVELPAKAKVSGEPFAQTFGATRNFAQMTSLPHSGTEVHILTLILKTKMHLNASRLYSNVGKTTFNTSLVDIKS
jgi:hypothetical protein